MGDSAGSQPGVLSPYGYGRHEDNIRPTNTTGLPEAFPYQQLSESPPPPAYAAAAASSQKYAMARNMDYDDVRNARNGPAPWWNYRTWSKRIWALIAVIVVVIIVVVVVPAVVVTNNNKANRYPDYTPLNYTLSETYTGTSFFDNFDYFNTYDPSGGFVHYVDPGYAAQYNLTFATSSTAVIKVDTTVGPDSDPNASTGRFSVRLQSKTQYNSGLFVFDVKHTPYGCATWPALWLTDPSNWPFNGEIDVMEAVNNATTGNSMTLHTSSGCEMGVKRLMTGTAGQADCNNATNDNTGCGVSASASTYGPDFNAAGGGVMAVEWRAEGIRMWQFGRTDIPADITAAQNPQPNTWGTALADFPSTDCNVGSHFRNQSIIVDIDLCGDLTNAVWGNSGCPYNCTYYVANFPTAFDNAYWEFGNFWIYNAASS